jgi:2-polyprenyl-3-methyl-5-hydroxy-6-metoxy-1,4-benzoquinol methylase
MDRAEEIKKQLMSTVGKSHYNGWNNRTTFGYHSYNIDEINVVGQRSPKIRLNDIKKHVNFENKNVIDFGCNVGAMLHHLLEINKGLGFDYDNNCINAANNISNILKRDNLEYMVHDFDRNTYEELKGKIKFKPDIIFILSLGSWVKSWKKLYETCLEYDSEIVLEINNIEEGKPQLDFFKNKGYEPILIVDNSLDDSTGNNRRKTYLINRK